MPSYATTDSVSRGNRRARVLGAGAGAGSSAPHRAGGRRPPRDPTKVSRTLALAQSRGIDQTSLPGRGLGIDAGAHVFR